MSKMAKEKEYDFFGRQYIKEDFKTDCVCLPNIVKDVIMSSLVSQESALADKIREQRKFIIDVATKGAEAAGKNNPDFNIVEFTRSVIVDTEGGAESPEEEAERLKKFAQRISNYKKNQWELHEAIREVIRNIPTCEGEKPPMNLDWKPPQYHGFPWEEK